MSLRRLPTDIGKDPTNDPDATEKRPAHNLQSRPLTEQVGDWSDENHDKQVRQQRLPALCQGRDSGS